MIPDPSSQPKPGPGPFKSAVSSRVRNPYLIKLRTIAFKFGFFPKPSSLYIRRFLGEILLSNDIEFVKKIHSVANFRREDSKIRTNSIDTIQISPAEEMGGGTEAFPELGRHCEKSDCNQLDFLPFTCNDCHKAFCLEHRSGKSHDCPRSDAGSRKVVVCDTCSIAIETTGFGGEDEKKILERHEKSGSCDPRRKKKPTCPVRRCKEVLTFSNTATCKTCRVKICLKHRFPADHACQKLKPSPSTPATAAANKFLAAFAARNGKDCGNKIDTSSSRSSVEAC